MWVDSKVGEGTSTGIELPVVGQAATSDQMGFEKRKTSDVAV
jgi:hypothetical protein